MFFIIALIVVIFLLVLFAEVKSVIHMENGGIYIDFIFLRFIHKHFQFDVRRKKGHIFAIYRIKKKKETEITDATKIILQVKRMNRVQMISQERVADFFVKKTRLNIRIDVKVGSEDAFLTAMICGALGIVSGVIRSFVYGEKRDLQIIISPVFTGRYFSIETDCIIAISPANIIVGYIIYKIKTRR